MIRVHTITIEARDVALVGRFWRDFLRYKVSPNHSDSVLLCGDGPSLLIQPMGSTAVVGRLHLDLRPDDAGAEVSRALSLGARRMDVAQAGQEGWTVMCDPEGNVFCVLQGAHEFEAILAADPGSCTAID
ncbi:VOC family protein [Flexivirga oryzae]|uniref:VOC domain-containing protein n=1 Tax=Flexivirga oryzae TaxID=1794944 RepID=A0A839NJ27_9MICO|nr:VOC family protein [Flexivirga oryzae]MBB2894372.1 hypothetical protein [Flexivirga oryzae]